MPRYKNHYAMHMAATSCGVQLARRDLAAGSPHKRGRALTRAVEEWLDGDDWAGRQFDANGWRLPAFARAVKTVYDRHYYP